MYDKTCHTCHGNFQHQSRNAKYCNEKCLDAARKRATGRQKRKRVYHRDPDKFRKASLSRKQARDTCIAETVIGACTRCGSAFYVRDLEAHHRDGDPFNNVEDNKTMHDHACHCKSDTEWRQAKKVKQPIQDVRKFKQLGVLVVEKVNEKFLYYISCPGEVLIPVSNPPVK